MLRSQKGHSGVSFDDTLLNFGLGPPIFPGWKLFFHAKYNFNVYYLGPEQDQRREAKGPGKEDQILRKGAPDNAGVRSSL